MNTKYMPDDKISYVGAKFAKEINSKIGWVIKEIENNPEYYVVEFGDDTYRMPAESLTPYRADNKPNEKNPANDIHGIEIRRNRKRASEDE